MGAQLYERCVHFHDDLERLDCYFKEYTGESVLKNVFNRRYKKTDPFERMLFTHSAIYMIEYCLTMLLHRDGVEPDFYLGTSLGEITATAIAADVHPREVIRLLVDQACVCEEKLHASSMIAVFANVAQLKEIQEIFPLIDIAAINYSGHFVVSGSDDAIRNLSQYLTNKSLLYSNISVPFAYHSRIFDDVKGALETSNLMSDLTLHKPCVSCSESKVLYKTHRNFIWNVIRCPINFYETLKNFDRLGSFTYLDLGPSGTLANFARQILTESGSESRSIQIMTPYANDYEKYREINYRLKNGD
jgi:trans-AT polyketide synthase/acyltransferase/oxidoreductase domain-containing protein